MRHRLALLVTAIVGAVSWFLWTGFALEGVIAWDGLPVLLRGTWAWDLRYALIPGYAAFVLWVAEMLGAKLTSVGSGDV